jgi:hypothetical protein
VWRVGASPVGLLAYLSLYWFAVDSAAVQHLSQSTASQAADSGSADSIDEVQPARTAV